MGFVAKMSGIGFTETAMITYNPHIMFIYRLVALITNNNDGFSHNSSPFHLHSCQRFP